jgi:hypothetical protein
MEVKRVAKKRCGTCKGWLPLQNHDLPSDATSTDRKISCDRGTPTCLQCARSRRTCKGYGLQLSWPTPGDARRAIVMKQQNWHKSAGQFSDAHLVHTFSRDVELHYHLTNSFPTRPTLRIPMPYRWTTSPSRTADLDLFQYCIAHSPARLFSVIGWKS